MREGVTRHGRRVRAARDGFTASLGREYPGQRLQRRKACCLLRDDQRVQVRFVDYAIACTADRMWLITSARMFCSGFFSHVNTGGVRLSIDQLPLFRIWSR